ncbi:MAG: hypothetical protein MCM46_02630 [Candidatus Manganitrophus sp. SB1]|nr:hypothetical protein [Candidatus Manganitrophus morganii]
MPAEPRERIALWEATASLPSGLEERFNGYGVMGLPFSSGHILAMRRFPASSVGSGYTSVWHRTPEGDWRFYADVSPRQACTRFFGALASDAIETEIRLTWSSPFRLHIAMPALSFEWEITAGTTAATRLMNAVGRLLPDVAWHRPAVLAMMGKLAGPLLGVGRVGLHGKVPNGQQFIANPRILWAIVESHARWAGEDFGSPGPVQPQARLGDFWIPQRGILAIGQAYFDPFDPARHSSKTSRSPMEAE